MRKIRRDLHAKVPEILPSVTGGEDEKDTRFYILTAACGIGTCCSSFHLRKVKINPAKEGEKLDLGKLYLLLMDLGTSSDSLLLPVLTFMI